MTSTFEFANAPVTVAIVLDNSGSMMDFMDANRQFIMEHIVKFLNEKRVELTSTQDFKFQYYLFDNTTVYSDTIESTPAPGGCTDLVSPFSLLRERNSSESSFRPGEIMAIVFISDGDDSRKYSVQKRFEDLNFKIPVPTMLLTVAVGRSFPTTTIMQVFYRNIHTVRIQGLPLVFQIPVSIGCNPDLEMKVQKSLEDVFDVISTRGACCIVPLSEDMTLGQLKAHAYMKYNDGLVRAFLASTRPEALEIINAIRDDIKIVEDLANRQDFQGSDDEPQSAPKPLPSRLLRMNARRFRGELLEIFTQMRTELNKLEREVSRGMILSKLSDEEQQEYMGFLQQGKFFHKAVMYNGLNVSVIRNSVSRFIEGYQGTDFYRALEEQMHGATQDEYLQDLKASFLEIKPTIESGVSILRSMPLIGRAVLFSRMTDGVQMNPWLRTVNGVSNTVPFMTSCDMAYVLSKFGTESPEMGLVYKHGHNEHLNGLVILADPAHHSFALACFLQTVNLCNDTHLFHEEARLAAGWGLLSYVLANKCSGEWVAKDLQLVDSICKCHNATVSPKWNSYLKAVASPQYKRCLVTNHTSIQAFERCPSVGKFILAMWYNVSSGHHDFTAAQLEGRRDACIVELVGRLGTRVEVQDTKACAVQPGVTRRELVAAAAIHEVASRHEQHISTLTTTKDIVEFLTHIIWEERRLNAKAMIEEAKAAALLDLDTSIADRVRDGNLTVALVESIFSDLAAYCCVELPALTQERKRFLQTVGMQFKDSIQRATAPWVIDDGLAYPPSFGREDVRRYVAVHFGVLESKDAHLLEECPLTFPPAFTARYKVDHPDRDVEVDFAVHPTTRLSRVVCGCVGCKEFLLVSPAAKTQKKAEVALRRHLQVLFNFCSSRIFYNFITSNMLLPRSRAGSAPSRTSTRRPASPQTRRFSRRPCPGSPRSGSLPRAKSSWRGSRPLRSGVLFLTRCSRPTWTPCTPRTRSTSPLRPRQETKLTSARGGYRRKQVEAGGSRRKQAEGSGRDAAKRQAWQRHWLIG